VKTWKAVRAMGYGPEDIALVLQMHDELIFSVRDDLLDEVRPALLARFAEPISGFLPFKTDLRTGPNWLATSK
jgi:DNA polymerase I-like protein with 3'-5' exonuclease and polymerase domains